MTLSGEESIINAFLPKLDHLFEQANSGGLVTMEKVQIINYRAGKK